MKIKNLSNSSSFLCSNSTNNLSNSSSQQTIRISEIDPLYSELTEEGLLETSFLNPEGSQFPFSSKKISIGRLGNFIGNNQTHEILLTNDKTIIGAINELKLNESGLDLRDGAGHNSIFRGKWLGPYPNADQYEAIDSGKFTYTNPITGITEDIYVGDYWQSDGPSGNDTVWRVACLDYYYNAVGVGYNPVLDHHAVIIPDTTIVQNVPYNPRVTINYNTDITDINDPLKGSYIGSYFESYLRGQCLTKTVTFTSTWHSGSAYKEYDNGYYFVLSRMDAPSAQIVEEVLISTDGGQTITRYPYQFKNGHTVIELDKNHKVAAGTLVYISYKYFVNPENFVKVNNYNNLLDAKQIIYNYFGQNHILQFYVEELKGWEQSGQWYQTDPSKFYGPVTYSTRAYITDIFLPTVASFVGSNYGDQNYYYKYAENLLGITGHIMTQNYFDSHRFPLFVYNPNLVNNRDAYWFRDMFYYYNSNNEKETYRFYHNEKNYACMNYDGIIGPHIEYTTAGIRPVFCLYKGIEEQENIE